MQSKKMIMFVHPEQIDDVIKEMKNDNVERGLIIRSNIGITLNDKLKEISERGYFPVGLLLEDSYNIEVLFKRHPKQTEKMKMAEIKEQ